MRKMIFGSARLALFSTGVFALALCFSLPAPDAAAQVYNKEESGTSAPLFFNNKPAPAPSQGVIGGVLPSKKTYGINSAQVSAPTAARAASHYEQQVAKQQAFNRQIRQKRAEVLQAEFDATRARIAAEDEMRMARERQMELMQKNAGQGVGELPAKATLPSNNPYPGSNVVFTGRQKEGEQKPARLFNTR